MMKTLTGGRVAAGLVVSLSLVATALPASPVAPPGPAGNAVLDWNAVAGEVAVAACLSPGGNPLHESRMYAMTSLAVHDALNAVERRYEGHSFSGHDGGASADAAVAAAARTVLVATVEDLPADLFGGCRRPAVEVAETAYALALAAVPDGPAESRGVALGRAAAEAILAERADDGSDTPLIVSDYPQGTEPGEWRFTPGAPFAFAPGWGEVDPFVIPGSAGFHVAGSYPVRSAAYAHDLAEVKALGGDGVGTPSARTPDQTEAARFWIESSPLQWNRIARGLAGSEGLDAHDAGRMFALLNMALADGYISSFAVKYDDPFWRPVTAIREADADGNRRTTGDPHWTPLDPTPPIPDHDSAHAVEGAAAATVIADVLGGDDAFSECSFTLPPGQRCDDATPTLRSFDGIWEAAEENAESRVLVGYHFRRATEVGLRHGEQVARFALDELPPARP
ncbi:vanadium-dependent haloperoxidase [Ornithinimicrobium cerasi]|uniref:PAP2 superfamily protein n=1 Tax=Ornithinimicrobium cerasi TaxID=2248773 RepID=A0A285VE52_9MICO|nr:vanadium-dependent haloperoxidase [Ornithinimicrobium cerasi]SOC52379.1 PAP2 superfamily protein [Ornithinimicrobium cerasi]